MKMNDFLIKDTTYKAKQAPVFNLNNEHKEAQLEIKIKDLEAKVDTLVQIRDEKNSIEKQLETQRNLSSKYHETIQTLDKQVSNLTMDIQDKQRIMDVSDGLRHDNDRLATEHGEAVHTLANLRMDIVGQEQELGRLRNNAFNLESNQRSMMDTAQQKDLLLRELTVALEDLKYQHAGLTGSSNALAKEYGDVSEALTKSDTRNLKLVGDVVILQKQQESTMAQEKITLERHTQAIVQRIRGESSNKINDLTQDVDTLHRLNIYYKNELSKPQHMSIGAIARQEGFKMPLASSAINYRKNNLGTGQATLLKFGKKESS